MAGERERDELQARKEDTVRGWRSLVTRSEVAMLSAVLMPIAALTLVLSGYPAQQEQAVRARADVFYREGIEHLRAEQFTDAIRSLKEAVSIDDRHAMAYYMLGRAHLFRQDYEDALKVLVRSRDIYVEDASQEFRSRADAEAYWRRMQTEVDIALATLRAIPRPDSRALEQIRQLEDRKRQIQRAQQGRDTNAAAPVPAFVLVSLGSAYFRVGKWADAEDTFRAALKADPRAGEAYNNLAVLFMELERYDEAERFVRAATKLGLRVAPGLEQEIARRKKAS
jgi:tetratricopeptide (TPR) repeat protein